MGFLDFLKKKTPDKVHKPSKPGKGKKPKRQQSQKIKQYWAMPMRKSLVEFASDNAWHLTRNRFSNKTAAKRAYSNTADIYHLMRDKYHLYQVCTPMRIYCQLPVKGRDPSPSEPMNETKIELAKLAYPTAILGMLARLVEERGKEETLKTYKFIERAYASPEKYAMSLLKLANQLGMTNLPDDLGPGPADNNPDIRPVQVDF